MMNVAVENTSELGRKLTVTLPAEEVQPEIEKRLRELARKVRLDGFRPGKVPLRIVRQRYGKQVEEEVAFELIQRSLTQALQEQKLEVAGQPRISDYQISGEGLTYTAEVELFPEIELKPLEELEIEKPVSKVTDEDVERVVQSLREQRKRWQEVDRPAREGDRLTIDYEASVEGERVGKEVKEFQFVLGEGKMVPGFEEQFLGKRAGETFTFTIPFPEDYADEKLAGKEVQFKVHLKRVEEGELPEIDEEFVKSFGVEEGTKEAFYREVRENLERQMRAALRQRLTQNVLQALIEAHQVPVPEGLVQQQLQRHLAPYAEALKKNPDLLKQLPLDELRERARREVLAGLLLAEIVEREGLKPDPERVQARAQEIAASYENPEEVVAYLLQDERQRSQLEQQVLEEMAVERVLERAQVKEKEIPFSELLESR